MTLRILYPNVQRKCVALNINNQWHIHHNTWIQTEKHNAIIQTLFHHYKTIHSLCIDHYSTTWILHTNTVHKAFWIPLHQYKTIYSKYFDSNSLPLECHLCIVNTHHLQDHLTVTTTYNGNKRISVTTDYGWEIFNQLWTPRAWHCNTEDYT